MNRVRRQNPLAFSGTFAASEGSEFPAHPRPASVERRDSMDTEETAMKPSIPILGFLVSCLLTTHASAAEGQPFQELQRQIDALKLEVERLKSPAVAYN